MSTGQTVKKAKIEKPSEKETRYDRGVRLWGSEGQKALEDGHICLVGATGAGCETLKNLILPGVGKVTIVDPSTVTDRDLGRNFFVTRSAVGSSRAETCRELLSELNPSNVSTNSISKTLSAVLTENSSFLNDVDCLILAEVFEGDDLSSISTKCRETNTHLVTLSSNGMLGFIRLQCGSANGHTIVEGFPDSEIHDLCVTNPFPQLQKYFESFNISGTTDLMEHSHIPWPVLAYQATKTWQASQPDPTALPTSYAQRRDIKEILKSMQLSSAAEENFTEAQDNLNKYLPHPIGDAIEKLFMCEEVNTSSDIYWIMVAALKEFYDKFGILPHSGVIPDMQSTTSNYTNLRDLFTDQHSRHVEFISEAAAKIAQARSCSTPISADFCKKFCKNARNLRVVKHSSIAEELSSFAGIADHVTSEPSDAWWYLLHRASLVFQQKHGSLPVNEQDCANLSEAVKSVLSSAKSSLTSLPDEYIKEWCRAGGSEIHTVASVIGGIASQEVIKLVTKQRVPVDNTAVFNGIIGNTTVWKF
eukprot:TRINITY_DN4366_c1_g1_i1.p1 TRINITY_DN4366_c1_g1~~TRINITY_DN4366_c1_g1_i1.p1  ORF type:complete len:548 (+),score=83.36 TRINITY_DN4366_c1_g1_i1:49-1644(+)